MNLAGDVFLPAPEGERNPWTLKSGLMLSGAGQCTESIHAMTQMQGDDHKPALVALYEGVNKGIYHQNPDITEAHTLFPGAVLQIGLQLPLFHTGDMLRLAAGAWEDQLRRMARNYRQIALPILLRIGYEFDGVEWNGYEPEPYILAYRAIAAILKAEKVHNVALVWDSHTVDTPDVMSWYPGDDVVDWIGYNTLAPKFEAANRMAAIAREKGMPLMNGEASYAIGVEAMDFDPWVKGYFASMHRDQVAAFQYINWRWQVYPSGAQWSTWADGRITDNALQRTLYCRAMASVGQGMVYRDATYAQPLCLSVACGRGLVETPEPVSWSHAVDHHTAEPGFGYGVQGAEAIYGDGWLPGWRGKGALTMMLTVPGVFKGVCLLRPLTQAKVNWLVNDVPLCWEPGHGYLHLAVSGSGVIQVKVADARGAEVTLSHVFLIQTGPMAAPESRLIDQALVWLPVEEALFYHVYRDGTLWEMVSGCHYAPVEPEHRWAVAAYHPQKGLGPLKEAWP